MTLVQSNSHLFMDQSHEKRTHEHTEYAIPAGLVNCGVVFGKVISKHTHTHTHSVPAGILDWYNYDSNAPTHRAFMLAFLTGITMIPMHPHIEHSCWPS